MTDQKAPEVPFVAAENVRLRAEVDRLTADLHKQSGDFEDRWTSMEAALAEALGLDPDNIDITLDDMLAEARRLRETVADPHAAEHAEIGRRWREDSSLAKWFPVTAENIEHLTAERNAREEDMREAAGELLVEIPEPGSVMAKLLSANVLMRADIAREREARERDARAIERGTASLTEMEAAFEAELSIEQGLRAQADAERVEAEDKLREAVEARETAERERDELLRVAQTIGEDLPGMDDEYAAMGVAGQLTRAGASLLVAAVRLRPMTQTGIAVRVEVGDRHIEVLAQWEDAPIRTNFVAAAAESVRLLERAEAAELALDSLTNDLAAAVGHVGAPGDLLAELTRRAEAADDALSRIAHRCWPDNEDITYEDIVGGVEELVSDLGRTHESWVRALGRAEAAERHASRWKRLAKSLRERLLDAETDHAQEVCGLVSNANAVREQHAARVGRMLAQVEAAERRAAELESRLAGLLGSSEWWIDRGDGLEWPASEKEAHDLLASWLDDARLDARACDEWPDVDGWRMGYMVTTHRVQVTDAATVDGRESVEYGLVPVGPPPSITERLRAMMAEAEDTACANCGEPWRTAEGHHFGQMYDGEWVCSAWCEVVHEDEGCPLEKPDGAAEMERRRARRVDVERSAAPPVETPRMRAAHVDPTTDFFGPDAFKPDNATDEPSDADGSSVPSNPRGRQ